jgi:septal ring factor EnvC (AmiA/AmiB activator)
VETHLSALDAGEVVRRSALKARRQELATVLDGLVRLSRRPAAALLASQSAPLDAFRGARLMSSVIPALDAEAAGLRRELQDLLRLRDEIAAERTKLAQAQAAATAERDNLDRLLAEKSAAQARFREERAAEEKRVAALAEQAKDLRSLIRKLAEEEARRKAEEEARRKQEETRQAEAERRRGEAAQRERENSERRLAALAPRKEPAAPSTPAGMPVLGRIVESFGQTDRFGQPSRGVRFETRPHAQVVSPQDGRIVFAGPFRDYGLLLILAHGDGYHTLLAGMSRLHGAVGQQVLAGEPVGEMGEAGAGPPTLYLELRRGGEPINPTPWLAAGKGKVSG